MNASKKLKSFSVLLVLFFAAAVMVRSAAAAPNEESKFETKESGDYIYLDLGDQAALVRYTGSATEITVPSHIDGKTVTELMFDTENLLGVFSKTEITSVTLPAGLKKIGAYTFEHCTSLERVILPGSLEYIGASAFAYCGKLNGIDIPKGVRYIGIGAFTNSGIEAISLPDSVEYLGGYSFDHCADLKSITLSPNLAQINERSFSYCDSLEEIVIPEGVMAIDEKVFQGSGSLKKVYFPKTLEAVYNSNIFDKSHSGMEITFGGSAESFDRIFRGHFTEENTVIFDQPLPSGRMGGFSPYVLTAAVSAFGGIVLALSAAAVIMKIKSGRLEEKYRRLSAEAAKRDNGEELSAAADGEKNRPHWQQNKSDKKKNNPDGQEYSPPVLGSWSCESCGTVNGSIGRYCYYCGEKRK